ncbi:hypothetical protein IAT38_000536 [Cryptococcus sp. DSM 104549]
MASSHTPDSGSPANIDISKHPPLDMSATFPTLEGMLDYVQLWAVSLGFAFFVSSQLTEESDQGRLRCFKRPGSKKGVEPTSCPCQVIIDRRRPDGRWAFDPAHEQFSLEHNHPPETFENSMALRTASRPAAVKRLLNMELYKCTAINGMRRISNEEADDIQRRVRAMCPATVCTIQDIREQRSRMFSENRFAKVAQWPEMAEFVQKHVSQSKIPPPKIKNCVPVKNFPQKRSSGDQSDPDFGDQLSEPESDPGESDRGKAGAGLGAQGRAARRSLSGAAGPPRIRGGSVNTSAKRQAVLVLGGGATREGSVGEGGDGGGKISGGKDVGPQLDLESCAVDIRASMDTLHAQGVVLLRTEEEAHLRLSRIQAKLVEMQGDWAAVQ